MIDQFQIGDFRNFSYLVTFDGESMVVDPQPDLRPWLARMAELGSRLTGVLLTHTHWDHVGGLKPVAEHFGDQAPPIYLHDVDARRLNNSSAEIKSRFRFVNDGDTIAVGSRQLLVMHTPGHSAGEICYYLQDEPSHLFTGDTVFVGDVGRTDLESGSSKELFETLQRLKQLPAETIIYPGHDYGRTPTSTLGRECVESAAFRCKTVKELHELP